MWDLAAAGSPASTERQLAVDAIVAATAWSRAWSIRSGVEPRPLPGQPA
jgi:hypothetical protein